MRLVFIIVLISFGTLFNGLAQNPTEPNAYSAFIKELERPIPGEGRIRIHQVEGLDILLNHYIGTAVKQQQRGIPGYRIRIFSDGSQSARQKMNAEKARFMKHFDKVDVYPVYIAPYWKIYVGDFLNRNDALRVFQEIKQFYPYAFIVNDFINIPD